MVDVEYSARYLVRIMGVLTEHDMITITNLAMLARMNHNRCANLVRLLEKTGFIKSMTVSKKYFLSLTDSGREYAQKLLEIDKMTNSIYS